MPEAGKILVAFLNFTGRLDVKLSVSYITL
jgi:hypothetical protein